MSWIQKLYETYNNCETMVGLEQNDKDVPLLPICHTTNKAQIEIVIDGNGTFRRARVVPKEEARTIIPCTEASGGRTSGEAAHPLCDKLQYVAADYIQRGGSRKSYHTSYVKQLEEWRHSKHSDPKLVAVLEYVRKGTVIGDLIKHQILVADKDGRLLDKWEKKKGEENPRIFDLLKAQEEAFVRWVVEIPGVLETRVWRDQNLWDKWIRYYSGTKKGKSLCLVTGEEDFSADQHPAKLRYDGDKAKLISSNDTGGFTYRGRFLSSEQAASVGFETTQKAHFALRWLINRQGYRKGDLAIVAWATSGQQVPKPTDDPLGVLGFNELPEAEKQSISTAQDVAVRLKNRIAGYGRNIGGATDVVVMGLDSATTGRMAITYYRELKGSDFLRRIDGWHENCAWIHTYYIIDVHDVVTGKKKKKCIPFIGAPAPIDITEAAYGLKADEALIKSTVMRLIPCIIEGRTIPRDLVESVVQRACKRVSLEKWEWNKTLSIACALYRNYNRKENFDMSLDPNRRTRDYLYGRLLALADSLEAWALDKAGEKRETNAARLMQQFAERPFSTWRTIELSLGPYKARLGRQSSKRQRMIDEVVATFNPDDFTNDKRLSGEFLLGYHCQREYLRSLAAVTKETEEDE